VPGLGCQRHAGGGHENYGTGGAEQDVPEAVGFAGRLRWRCQRWFVDGVHGPSFLLYLHCTTLVQGPYRRALVTDLDGAGREFATLAANLRLVGEEELRRELFKAISDAAQPLAQKVSNAAHLYPYMPDRYADVLAGDLAVTVSKRTGGSEVGVFLRAKGRHRDRQVRVLNEGFLRHPVFADAGSPRRSWRWKTQTGGMRAGFFTDPTEAAGPAVRRQILQAMHRIAERAVGR
jgi:hypothetical protein